MRGFPILVVTNLVLIGFACCRADEYNHQYNPGEDVAVWFSTVGPYANRYETYSYTQMPYCSLPVVHKKESLGEALQGMELIHSGIDVRFGEDRKNVTMCQPLLLNEDQIDIFQYAIRNLYWFEVFVDGLPAWGYVGATGLERPAASELLLFTHREFILTYNDNRIVQLDIAGYNPVVVDHELMRQNPVQFTYSAIWRPTTSIYFSNRFDRYLDKHFFQHSIHWFSIANSFLLVFLLALFVLMVMMRVLKKDLARYEGHGASVAGLMLADLEPDFGADEYGWKLIHGDVFRTPVHRMYLAALVGIGRQLLVAVLLLLLGTVYWDLYEDPASMLTMFIATYSFSSSFAGYVSASIYKQNGGKNWVKNVLNTASIFPLAITIVGLPVNAIAMYYSSTRAIPFMTMLALAVIWLVICLPLTLLGSVLGRHYAGAAQNPCRVHPLPRQIPEKPWYLQPLQLSVITGLLPFASIFIETYMILAAFWSYRVYYVYGFALLVSLILISVTTCVTIVSMYLLLNAEDHEWRWKCVYVAGAPAFYVYAYSIYFFYHRTKMSGVFQTAFYFGHTALICFTMFLILGSVGYYVANLFVRRIYRNIKVD